MAHVTAAATPRRRTPRSATYLAWLRDRPCTHCRRPPPSEAAHVRLGNGGGIALKPSDLRAVPLCHACHAWQHRIGERDFWAQIGRDPDIVAIRSLVRFAADRDLTKPILAAIEERLVVELQGDP